MGKVFQSQVNTTATQVGADDTEIPNEASGDHRLCRRRTTRDARRTVVPFAYLAVIYIYTHIRKFEKIDMSK